MGGARGCSLPGPWQHEALPALGGCSLTVPLSLLEGPSMEGQLLCPCGSQPWVQMSSPCLLTGASSCPRPPAVGLKPVCLERSVSLCKYWMMMMATHKGLLCSQKGTGR